MYVTITRPSVPRFLGITEKTNSIIYNKNVIKAYINDHTQNKIGRLINVDKISAPKMNALTNLSLNIRTDFRGKQIPINRWQ